MYQQAYEFLKDENGQVSFADAIYYDELASLQDKIFWLKECVKEGQTKQQARVDVLERKLAEQKS